MGLPWRSLIELNGTLGHLSWSIKKVSADGAVTPPLLSARPHSQDDISCHQPLRHRHTNLILFTILQFLSLPQDYYLPDKLPCFYPANMNKQALCSLLGQRAWLNESENPKKDCLPSVHQLLDNYSRASCRENRWCVSTHNMGFLSQTQNQPVVCSDTETATKWQPELPNGAGLRAAD